MQILRFGASPWAAPRSWFVHHPNFISLRSRQSLAVITSAGKRLEEWQIEKLEAAFVKGKRKIQIRDFCEEVKMDRPAVLDWFKQFGDTPVGKEMARNAEAERAALARWVEDNLGNKEEPWQQKSEQLESPDFSVWGEPQLPARPLDSPASPSHSVPERTLPAESSAPSSSAEVPADPHSGSQVLASPGGSASTQEAVSVNARDLRFGKQLSKAAEQTLEAVYQRKAYPSTEVMESIYDLHRLPRRVVVEWFERRRSVDPQQQQRREQRVGPLKKGGRGKTAGRRQ